MGIVLDTDPSGEAIWLLKSTGAEPSASLGNRIWSGRRGSNPRPSAWKAEWADSLPHQIRRGNFRSKMSRFEHLTQDVLSI